MILTCEKCATRFLVSASALGATGRRVRCSQCAHEWFQEPEEGADTSGAWDESDDDMLIDLGEQAVDSVEEEPVAQEMSVDEFLADEPDDEESAEDETFDDGDEEDFSGDDVADELDEDIPDSIKPLPVTADEEAAPVTGSGEPWTGYAAAAGIFVLIFVGLLALKGPLTTAMPSTAGLYKLLGISTAVPGEGLIFDGVRADIETDSHGAPVLRIKGNLINLGEKPIDVPALLASVRKEGDEVLHSWVIDAPQPEIAPHEELTFSAETVDVPEEARAVNVTFVLGGTAPDKGSDALEEEYAADSHEEPAKPESSHEAPAHGNDSHGGGHH
ncbi:MAG: zinc-ribbon domain-containing protein [Rhodospirillales bacterium]|nr:zinc-ribbon domain-containing protein [Rhodospirillales bacterium]